MKGYFSLIVIVFSTFFMNVENQINIFPGDYCFPFQILFGTQLPTNAIKVTYLLFTCNNKDQPQNFTYLSQASDWNNSNFNTSVKTRYIIHGYQEKYPGITVTWLKQMKDLILAKSCENVVVIDWSEPANASDYFQSVSNTRVVGQMISCTINRLKTDINYSPDNYQLIGHSLGAHISGFAGKKVNNPKIRQITALDAAGLGYQYQDNNNRLAYSDAKCVVAMHTDASQTIPLIEGLGIWPPVGNVDFFPNGGQTQPGCHSPNETLLTQISDFFNSSQGEYRGCDHNRCRSYAIVDQSYATNPKCQPIGYYCDSYESFKLGKCADCFTDGCKPMPLNLDYWDNSANCNSNNINWKYYLDTGANVSDSTYCLFHYQIIVTLQGMSVNSGQIQINLSSTKQITLTGANVFGTTYWGYQKFTSLYTDPQEVSFAATIGVVPSSNINLANSKIEFKYLSHIDSSVRQSLSAAYCSANGINFARC